MPADPADAPRQSETARSCTRAFALIVLARTTEALAGGILLVAVPAMLTRGAHHDAGVAMRDTGLALSLFGCTLLLGQSAWARLPKHWATPRFAAAAMFASASPIIALDFQRTTLALLTARSLQGLAVGLATPPLLAWIARSQPARAGRRLGFQNSVRMVAFALGPFVAGFVIDSGFSSPYLLCGAAIAIAGLLLFAATTSTSPEGTIGTAREATATASSPILSLAAFSASGAATSFVILQPAFAQNYGLSHRDLGIAASAMLITRALLEWKTGAIADRWPGHRLIVAALSALAVGTGIVAFATSMPALCIGRIVQGIGMASFTTPAFRLAARSRCGLRGLSAVGSGFSAGLILGPLLTSVAALAVSTAAPLLWVLPLLMSAIIIAKCYEPQPRETRIGTVAFSIRPGVYRIHEHSAATIPNAASATLATAGVFSGRSTYNGAPGLADP